MRLVKSWGSLIGNLEISDALVYNGVQMFQGKMFFQFFFQKQSL